MMSRLSHKIFKLLNVKHLYENEKYLQKQLKSNLKKVKPPFLQRKLWKEAKIGSFNYYETNTDNFEQIIVYFHGGAFVSQPNILHWDYLKRLQPTTNSKIYFPIYPKTPTYSYKEAYVFLNTFFETIKTQLTNKKVVFMGDSAGGNIALSFALQIAKSFVPDAIILFSPCLDLTLSSKEIEQLEKDDIDPMLSKKGLLLTYTQWAKGLSLEKMPLSPIFEDCSMLKNINIFVGTQEILYPEALKFYELNKQNTTLIVQEGQVHAYPLHPIKEAKPSFDRVCQIIKSI